MRSSFLPFSPPLIGDEEIAEVVDTLRSGWITTGPKVKQFEVDFATFVGAPAALALSSCTAALHVALTTLGVRHGDAVITTPMTFCSGVHVIEHVGAKPVLVDVEPDTLNMDPALIAEAITKCERATGTRIGEGRIKAIMPVHLYGHPCDMGTILSLARDHGIAVVEDAAHALPARFGGRTIGSFALAGNTSESSSTKVLTCFSFYATKNLTTAEGGMLTGASGLLEDARVWSLHGMSQDAWKRYTAEGSWYYDVVLPGFKYNMTDIQAAIGLHQLRKLPGFHSRRRQIAQKYTEVFGLMEELQTPTERPNAEHAWHLYVLRLNMDCLKIDRNQFIEELKVRNIGTSVHFIPVHLHPYYRNKYGYKPDDFPVAYHEYQRIISLPTYPGMSAQDVQDVIDAVCDVVQKFRR